MRFSDATLSLCKPLQRPQASGTRHAITNHFNQPKDRVYSLIIRQFFYFLTKKRLSA